MKKLVFTTAINAPVSKVWKVLWSDETYNKWTSVFSPGSTAKSDWKEGSKVHFLDGQGNGMFSVIDELKAHELMSFRHIGLIKNGEEQPEDEETKKWSGSIETYTLSNADGKTELKVEVDVDDAFGEYMNKTFPEALKKVKELSESNR